MNFDHLSEKELAGAWRRICGAMIIQGAVATCLEADEKKSKWISRSERQEKSRARDWVQGADAVVTFEEAAETLGLNPECLRRSMQDTRVQDAARTLRRAQSGRSFVGKRHKKTTKLSSVATPQAEGTNELLREHREEAAA